MAAVIPSPVELPTRRQSRSETPVPNVHDPNYIPLLDGSDLNLDFVLPFIRPFSPTPPHTPEPQLSDMHQRSKSSTAPERAELEAEPFPAHLMHSRQTNSRAETESRRETSDDGQITVTLDGTTMNNSTTSMVGAAIMLDDQIYTIPGNFLPRKDDLVFPPVPASARSSMSGKRKAAVPTSKYNRKPVTGSPAMSTGWPSKPQTPGQSPKLSAEPIAHELPAPLSSPQPFVEPLDVSISRLQARKSSASERRGRALHSHPSNVSSKSRPNSSESGAEEMPVPSVSQSRMRTKSTESSRTRGTLYDTQPSTPAPTSPLPDLPIHVKRPPTRERALAAESQMVSSPGPSPKPQKEHFEMAAFMTTRNTVVFRRFDEVHVRLLLQLQDEIAVLEKEMADVEHPNYNKADKIHRKLNIMRDLRQLLAEYDHLFANWSSMQTHKAESETRQSLENWLRDPAAGATAISPSAKRDLAWLQNAKDLSAVDMRPVGTTSKETALLPPSQSVREHGGGGGGGLAAFFGCAGRRK